MNKNLLSDVKVGVDVDINMDISVEANVEANMDVNMKAGSFDLDNSSRCVKKFLRDRRSFFFFIAIAALILILGQMGHVDVRQVSQVGQVSQVRQAAIDARLGRGQSWISAWFGISQFGISQADASSAPYSWSVPGSDSASGSGLTLASHRGFQQVSEDGFGSRHNSYAWSSAWFKGKLYVGTNRDMLCYLAVVFGTDPTLIDDADCDNPDYRGEIWAYDPEGGGSWSRVYQSPLATPASGGAAVPRDQGYRGMVAVVEPDGTEALYIGGYTSKEVLPVNLPARLLRSVDGVNFTELHSSDSTTLGNADTFGLRSFTQYKGKLYMTANMNPPQRPRLLEANLATLSTSGTGTLDVRQVNPSSVQPFELEVFNNYLYVGTIDTQNGYSVLKTNCTGTAPYTFTPVVTHGAWRKDRAGQDGYNLNEYVLSMCVFQDRLYIGSGCGLGGYDFVAKVGPAPAELIRIEKNDKWQLVCGKKRTTPDGIKVPISHLTAGMGNPFSGYFWRMAVHRDWLYVATMDSSIALRNPDIMSLLDPNKVMPNGDYTQLVQMGLGLAGLVGFSPFDGGSSGLIDRVGENIVNILGGFDLWKTRNGVQWYPVTTTGFGDKFNIGARILVSTPLGLFIGTANPYNGAQVWLGDDHFPIAKNLQAEPTGDDPASVKLRWTVPADISTSSGGDVVSHIYRRQVLGRLGGSGDLFLGLLGEDKAGLRGLTEVASTTKQYYIDTDVEEGMTYLYQVSCATSGGGTSGGSGVDVELSDRSNISLCRVPNSATRVFTQRPRPDRKQGQWTQAVTLFNTTDTPLFSTMYYILEGLSTNTKLLNRSGTAENGSSYLQIPVSREGLLPGQRLQFQLRFSSPGSSGFNYVPFVNTDNVGP